jgi:type IV pilus assembly protein PilB
MLLTVVTSSHGAIARAFERLYNPGSAKETPPPPAARTAPSPSPEDKEAKEPARGTSELPPAMPRPALRRGVPAPRVQRGLGAHEAGRTPASRSSVHAVDLELLGDQHAEPAFRAATDSQARENADDVVRRLLSIAIDHDASDIHLEMLAHRLQIRFRIDGLLEQIDLGELQAACDESAREIVSRFKILGRLDIAERRRPQDGRFRLRIERRGEQREIDLRLSIVPSHYGESVVVRVLDRKKAPTSLVELDFPRAVSDTLRQLLGRPSGILLVTGPTGSGKSTTVYASLMTVYRPSIRVLTAEDPIEYLYDQFSQSEVNEQIGNTFAHYLRAFLRHDPEVIMVGEIRDDETAAMAFRAAQTGHLLLSTLHTNSAVETIQRLREMKVDANTLASSLLGVLNQRLARKVCNDCRTEYEPAPDLLREFYEVRPPQMKFYKGDGCATCSYTGYRGRLTVAELWVPSQHDIVLISKGVPSEELRTSTTANTCSMADAAMHRLREGRTNLEELIRVLPYQVVYDFRQRLGSGKSAGENPEEQGASAPVPALIGLR